MIKAALVIAFVIWPSLMSAFQISVKDISPAASITVSANDVETQESFSFTLLNGLHTLDVDRSAFFESDAYRTLAIEITWTPTAADHPALNVEPMTIELRILLRQWVVKDILINSNYFTGIGDLRIERYEDETLASQQIADYLGAMLMRQHFQLNRINSRNRHALRITRAAFSAAFRIQNQYDWFLPSEGLRRYIETSLIGLPTYPKDITTFETMASAHFSDLLNFQTITKNNDLSCEQVDDFFQTMIDLSEQYPNALLNYFPDGNFDYILTEKQNLAAEAGCI